MGFRLKYLKSLMIPGILPGPKVCLVNVRYNEELIPYDLDNDGILDIVGGQYWFQNQGDGTFKVFLTDAESNAARIALSDCNNDGRMDIVVGQEVMDFPNRNHTSISALMARKSRRCY